MLLDAPRLMHAPMRAICDACRISAPPHTLTIIMPPRSWDYGEAGSARITVIAKGRNALALMKITRRGACVEIACGMTMRPLTGGPLWYWLLNGRQHRRLYLWPDSDTLSTKRPYRCQFNDPLQAAHVALVDLYQSFGMVWTGDQSIPPKPRRMTHERYGRLVARIRSQWDVLSGRQPNV